MVAEEKAKKDNSFRRAYEIIELWRSKSSTLSTLYQDLRKREVLQVIDRFKMGLEIQDKKPSSDHPVVMNLES